MTISKMYGTAVGENMKFNWTTIPQGWNGISPVTPMPEVRRAKFLVVFFCL